MATLYLMVGLPCSGKTTRAKEFENECFALRLTPDDWHVNLFGHDILDPDHDKRHYLIEDMFGKLPRVRYPWVQTLFLIMVSGQKKKERITARVPKK